VEKSDFENFLWRTFRDIFDELVLHFYSTPSGKLLRFRKLITCRIE
jgi:hypothetical protein